MDVLKGNAPTSKSGRETETTGKFNTFPKIAEGFEISGITQQDIRDYNAAVEWVNEHPAIFADMVKTAKAETRSGGYVSASGLLHYSRMKYRVSIPNHFGTIIPRLIKREYPDICFGFKLHKSKFDKLVSL